MPSIAGKIMIIRHAEKPRVSGGGAGIARDGTEDPESLTVRGWTRARLPGWAWPAPSRYHSSISA